MHSLRSLARIPGPVLGGPVAAAILLAGPPAAQAEFPFQLPFAGLTAAPLAPGDPGLPRATRKASPDADGDGLSDWTEVRRTGTNPRRRDTDRDRLSDWTEVKRTKTNPLEADSDGDGFGDGEEVSAGSNPRDPASIPNPSHSPETGPSSAPGPTSQPPTEETPPPDTTPPETAISAHPSELTNSAAASFAFSGSDTGGSGVASFECRRDGGSWGACASPKEYAGLANGAHSFEVRAVDGAGNADATPASFAWTVDTAAPDAPVLASTLPPSPANDNDPRVIGSALAGTTVKLYAGGGCSGTPAATVSAAALESGVSITVGKNSATSFRATATTVAGNVSGCSGPLTYVEDSSAPGTTIGAHPAPLSNSASASFAFSGGDGSGSGVASFECRRDGGAWGACTSPKEYAGLADGGHQFEVRAIDSAGNVDATPASFDWTIDTAAPSTTLNTHPNALTNSAAASFGFSGSDSGGSGVASFECRRDGGAWGACTSPKEYTGLADGTHGFEVRAIDNAGNADASPASFTWTVDTTPPETAIGAHPNALTKSTSGTFAFSGSDGSGSGVASFECRRDGGAWATCTSPKEYAGLADGIHGFETRAIDSAGNVDATPASVAWTVDTTPPALQIDSGPSGLTNNPSPTFGFSSEPGASFECSIDSGTPSFGPCSGPSSHTPAAPLSDGPHTIRVRATDGAGNQAVVTRGFEIDTRSPATTLEGHPPPLSNSALALFAFSGSDPSGSGIASFECRRDGGAWGACSSPKEYAGLADGAHSFEARAVDKAGNVDSSPATYPWTIDTAAPSTTLNTHPNALTNSAAASFGFSGSDPGGSGVASFECRRDGGAWGACASPKEYSGLADGNHSFEVRAIDSAGNVDASSASFTWSVDTTPPTVGVDSGPLDLTNDTTPSFGFSSEPGASFECSIDAGTPSFGPCSGPSSHTPAAPLSDGPHTFRVRATDGAANQATATRSFVVDTTAPDAPALSATLPPSPASDNAPRVIGSAPAGTTVKLYSGVDCSGTPIATVSPAELAAGISVTVLDDSATSFRATATTAAGNTSGCSEPLTYVEDSSAPDTTIATHANALSNSASASFGLSGSDSGSGVASFECRRDGGSWGTCTSPTEYTGLAEGAHSFEVRALDRAGNVDATPVSFTWQVDLTAPQVTIDSLSKSLLKAGETSEISWHAGEDGSFELRLGGAGCDTGAVIGSGAYAGHPAPHVSSVTAAQLAEGANTLRLCLTDAAGNRGAATTSVSRDTVAPNTQIDAMPPAATSSTAAKFAFSGSDAGGSGVASFQCRRDGVAWAACTSPREYTAMAEGAHEFEVKAVDNAGNADGSAASFDWTVDTTPPAVQVDSGPTGRPITRPRPSASARSWAHPSNARSTRHPEPSARAPGPHTDSDPRLSRRRPSHLPRTSHRHRRQPGHGYRATSTSTSPPRTRPNSRHRSRLAGQRQRPAAVRHRDRGYDGRLFADATARARRCDRLPVRTGSEVSA